MERRKEIRYVGRENIRFLGVFQNRKAFLKENCEAQNMSSHFFY